MENNFKKWKNRDVLNARDYVFERDTIVDEINIAQKNQFYPNTRNDGTVTIAKGDVVQFLDSQGDWIKVKKAVASEVNADPSLLMGLARDDIEVGQFGDVVWFGNIFNYATGSFTLGQILWFDPSTGGLTATEPDTNKIQLAAVEKQSSNPQSENGILLVRVKFVSRSINDINEIQVEGAATGSVLRKAANGDWVPSNLEDFATTFATDAELTAGLATKEDAFSKNTAFNKNFGTTAGTVAEGDHTHDDRYYTETELNNGQLDTRYYTETELDAGQLDTRYYTETEVDNTFIPLSQKGENNGVAELNESGKVPTSQLPSYVDDILEAYVRDGATPLASDWLSLTGTTGDALTPEAGKIYMVIGATDTNYVNTTYRWGGSVYAVIGDIALGETSATAYRGDRGKIAYDHTFLTNNPHAVTAAQAGAVALTGDTMTGALSIGTLSTALVTPLNIKTDASGYAIQIERNDAAETWQVGVDTTGDLNFHNSGSATPSVVFNDDGNVGIGTTSPSAKLHINGSTAGLEIDNTSTNHMRILSYDRVANTERQLETRGSLLRYTTNANERMRITSTGNVGIGTTTPTEKLEVNGIIKGSALHTGGDDDFSTALGVDALANDDGSSNVNTAVGYRALRDNTTGSYNTANGVNALRDNTTGDNNTAEGRNALFSNTTGSYNTANGVSAGRYIANGTTGNTTGDYNTFIGAETKALADNDQNETVIGYNAIGNGSNTVTIGNDDVTDTHLKGDVQTSGTVTGSNITSTTLTLGSFTLEYNEATQSLNFNFSE